MLMQRRTFLGVAAAGPAGLMFGDPSRAVQQGELPTDVGRALAEFRKSIPSTFDHDYVEHAVIPFFLTTVFEAERPALPMIDVTLTKENALPYDLWGLIYKQWKPTPDEGVTVFLQGLEHRGDHNLRKRIYASALTPDLYHAMYQKKVVAFFDHLFDARFAGQPFMRHYLDYYFDLYWDLHVGVQGTAIPAEVRQIGESFNTVLAYRNPKDPIVYEHYMKVRAKLDTLKGWIAERVDDVATGKVSNPERTFVHYWLRNAGDGTHFSRKDVVFEAFHNFVALSQWGNTMFGIMSRLRNDGGDPDVRAAFTKAMTVDPPATPFTPLELFVMELFRTISPNGGSLSAVVDARASQYGESPYAKLRARFERHLYAASPHTSTSMDPRHWTNPRQFDPDRYKTVPTSAQIDDAKAKEMGFPRCPFDITALKVADGRNAEITNSAFGTVFGVVDGKAMPVCDYAGFAPFGFGYRRCPGEQLTVNVFEDFLRKVWTDKIEFVSLGLPSPKKVPIGPTAVIDDGIGFRRA
jgi:cytochrome P450